MKVKLLKEVGIHKIGAILDIDGSFIPDLISGGTAERYVEEIPSIYVDLSGKEYTEEQVSKMDKRTNLYKELVKK